MATGGVRKCLGWQVAPVDQSKLLLKFLGMADARILSIQALEMLDALVAACSLGRRADLSTY